MRTGIVILPELRWAEAQHRWKRAEEYGFSHGWTYDHIGWRDLVDGPWFDSIPTLTAAALATSAMKIGIGVASANFRHPAHFAREVLALDDISQGRLLVGLGSGGLGYDSAVLGRAPLSSSQRVDRFTEFAELLDRILHNSPVTWSGEYYSAMDARGDPGPIAGPRIPLVIAGSTPRSIELAARLGDAWITTGRLASGSRCTTLEEWWSSVEIAVRHFETRSGERDVRATRRYLWLDAAPTYSLSSVDTYRRMTARARDLNFTDVLVHWPRTSGWFAGRERTVEELAAAGLLQQD